MNACQGARVKVSPAHSPLECRRKPKKSIAWRAAARSKRYAELLKRITDQAFNEGEHAQ